MGEDSETEDELNSSDDWDNATNTADNFANNINSENETHFQWPNTSNHTQVKVGVMVTQEEEEGETDEVNIENRLYVIYLAHPHHKWQLLPWFQWGNLQ